MKTTKNRRCNSESDGEKKYDIEAGSIFPASVAVFNVSKEDSDLCELLRVALAGIGISPSSIIQTIPTVEASHPSSIQAVMHFPSREISEVAINFLSERYPAKFDLEYLHPSGLSSSEVLQVLFQLALGLYDMREGNTEHRDIKPGNVVAWIDSQWEFCLRLNIIDLDNAKTRSSENGDPSTHVGTRYYAPFEDNGWSPDFKKKTKAENYGSGIVGAWV